MADTIENWKTQIRKGYLELCVLAMVQNKGRVYGFELLAQLEAAQLDVKEGTLYPLLNRMTADELLHPTWETQAGRGHPRKFYALTKKGASTLTKMKLEFENMNQIYQTLNGGPRNDLQQELA